MSENPKPFLSDFPISEFPLQRPRYFAGQYLLVEDFQLEHSYLYERQRYQASRLYVSGIIEGLEVTVEANMVKITPGSAIDVSGRLIILSENGYEEDVSGLSEGEYWLCIEYHEEMTDELQSEIPGSNNRFQETPQISIESTAPDDSRLVTLAKITKNGATADVDPSVCQYSGIYLPSSQGRIKLRAEQQDDGSYGAYLEGDLRVTRNLTVSGVLSVSKPIQSEPEGLEILNVEQIADLDRFFEEENFSPWGDGDNGIYYMEGNVGIGTEEPQKKLDVQGDLEVNGNIYLGDTGKITSEAGANEIQFNSDDITIKSNSTAFSIGIQDILSMDATTVTIGRSLQVNGNLKVGDGVEITQFIDTLDGGSSDQVPTAQAIKDYVDSQVYQFFNRD
ncbi:MAG: hypothetical protein F6K47_37175 [Symploca sp. SIO2E6]|nr:hypothetical protein [Symploca sp. SIO2E6]